MCRSKDEDGQPLSLQEQVQGLRNALFRVPIAFANYYAAYASLSKSARLISTDLHQFLTSESSEVPQSLRQCGRLLEAGVRERWNAFMMYAGKLFPSSFLFDNLLKNKEKMCTSTFHKHQLIE
jgi:hypothetical protein